MIRPAKTNNGAMMKTRLITTALCCAVLAACSSPPSQPTQNDNQRLQTYRDIRPQPQRPRVPAKDTFNPALADSTQVEEWLAAADSADPEDAAGLLLRASEVLLRDGELARADDVVSPLSTEELPPEQALRLAMIRARVHRGHGEFSEALDQLSTPIVEGAVLEAPIRTQLQFSQLRASLFAIEGDHLSAVQEWIFIDPLLTPVQQSHNREAIWASLMQIPTQTLIDRLASISNRDYMGWLELASIAKDNQGDIEAQIRQRNAWLSRWPTHPARKDLPGGLGELDALIVERPNKIGLLLPVTGRYSVFGKAIRDGFFAAYHDARSQGAQVPVIQLYDSASQNITELYQQAQTDGNELIIGPLRKGLVSDLTAVHNKVMPLPTLALNRIDGTAFPSGLYQFGLNPEDEAIQIADIAQQKGFKRALLITPEGDWGNKVAEAFSQRWQSLGGTVVTSANFDARQNNYSKNIKQVLQLDRSERRRQRLQQVIGKRPHFEPYRRTDIDFIFLVARPNEGRAVMPLLAYHYAGDIPVFATSHIYHGNTDPSRDQDINGVYFVDIPWVFNPDSAIRRNIREGLRGSDAYQRMYALGVDSFRLHLRLKQLRHGGGQVFGETGTLSLNDLGQIERELTLAHIAEGRAQTDMVPRKAESDLPAGAAATR